MSKFSHTEAQRLRRKQSIRKRIHGTPERPRLVVYRSLSHIYAQVVNDEANSGSGHTLAEIGSRSEVLREVVAPLKKTEAAEKVGEAIGRLCAERGISKVVFDRNGFLYHGRVKAVAEGARKAGLSF
jgi:large subunit ribosomal protein L18